VKKRANKNETNDPQHRPNGVFIVITILPISRQALANVSFQDKVKIKQISFGVSVVLVEKIRGLLCFGMGH